MRDEAVPERISKGRVGVPLTALSARPIVRWLFEKNPQWRRKDLAAEVQRIHARFGGVSGAQQAVMVIKKTLQHLVAEGDIESVTNGFGLWRYKGAAEAGSADVIQCGAELAGAPDEDEDAAVIETVGEGSESVYVYFNPNDRRLASLEGRGTWECKVGRTEGSVHARLLEQGAKTALSHTPVIALVMRTPDAGALERAVHAALRLADATVDDSPGTEWFMTSPERIKKWHEGFTHSLEILIEASR